MDQHTGKKKAAHWNGILCLLAFVWILGTGSSTAGAVRNGISIALQTVIPALLPLLVLSKIIMNTDLPEQLGRILGPAMGKLFSAPPQAAICLVLGVIGGYPVGAQSIADAHRSGRLTRAQAEHLLGFCNNAGPAFIFGMMGAVTGGAASALVLYIIHILSALIIGILLKPHSDGSCLPCDNHVPPDPPGANVIPDSLRALGSIALYVILMQVVLFHLKTGTQSWMPPILQVALSGFLELATGTLELQTLDSMGWRYCMASGFLGFGGICVWLQTRSVLQGSGLRGSCYLRGKILQGGISALLTWGSIVLFPKLLPLDAPTVHLPNHDGLLVSMVWTVGAFFLFFSLRCFFLAKRAGKKQTYGV